MRCWTAECDRSRDTTTATRIRSVVGCAARVEEQLQLCCGPPVVVRGTGVVLIVASAGGDGDGEAGQGPVEAVALAPVARGALSAALRVLHHDDPWQADDGRPS